MILTFTGCGGSSSNSDDDSIPGSIYRVPANLFGASIAWERLGDKIMGNGDMITDRSFRTLDDGDDDTDTVWVKILNDGTVSMVINESEPGYSDPVNMESYTGYLHVEQSISDTAYNGVYQLLTGGVRSGEAYQVEFSSYGVSGNANVHVVIYDKDFNSIAMDTASQAINTTWTRHVVTLTPGVDEKIAIFGIYLFGKGNIKLDEVRLFEGDAIPYVKSDVKTKIQELGIKSLRWPGGTLVDWFNWKGSVGPMLSREETRCYRRFETPALGLHEFLNLCEELNIAPLIQVNVVDTPGSAADLVEYVLSPSTTTQGSIRKGNGRTEPWNAVYFEIGNEPPNPDNVPYNTIHEIEETAVDYAVRATLIASQMKAKASSLGKTIKVSGIAETSFQLPDWINPLPAIPEPTDPLYQGIQLLHMLHDWNTQAFVDNDLKDAVDFVHGHFYASRRYHSDQETNFRYIMSGGEVLRKTVEEKVTPHTGDLPIWITEYNVTFENEDGKILPEYFPYFRDYQSGLSIADMLITMIEEKYEGAHIWNLAQGGIFGMLLEVDGYAGWHLKPAGIVLKLLSVMAGEKRLAVSVSEPGSYLLTDCYGNVPSNLSYPLVSAVASENALTGKARVVIINRDYSDEKKAVIDLEGFTPGNAIKYTYSNIDLSANNETVPDTVKISEESIIIDDAFEVTVPKHSLIRIDFQ